MNKLKVIWSIKSKQQLKIIFDFYKLISVEVANNVKESILKSGRDLIFVEQYQKDEIEPEFRRIIVGHYKLVYIIEEKTIIILRIFDTRRNPKNQIENI